MWVFSQIRTKKVFTNDLKYVVFIIMLIFSHIWAKKNHFSRNVDIFRYIGKKLHFQSDQVNIFGHIDHMKLCKERYLYFLWTYGQKTICSK